MRLNKSKVLFPTFSLLYLFYSYIEAPHHRPQNYQLKIPTPKTQSKTQPQNPNPHTKMRKKYKE